MLLLPLLDVCWITFYFVVSNPPSNFLIFLISSTYLASLNISVLLLLCFLLNWVEIHISKSNLALAKECSQAYFIEKLSVLSFPFCSLLIPFHMCMWKLSCVHKNEMAQKERSKKGIEAIVVDNRMWCLISSWCLETIRVVFISSALLECLYHLSLSIVGDKCYQHQIGSCDSIID